MEYTSGIGTCQWLIRVILVSPYLIMDNPHYIVVEGPSGVGKTALAQKLSKTFESRLLLETAFDNPFLGRFYQDRRQYALQTQLAFLIGRIQQLEKLNQDDIDWMKVNCRSQLIEIIPEIKKHITTPVN